MGRQEGAAAAYKGRSQLSCDLEGRHATSMQEAAMARKVGANHSNEARASYSGVRSADGLGDRARRTQHGHR